MGIPETDEGGRARGGGSWGEDLEEDTGEGWILERGGLWEEEGAEEDSGGRPGGRANLTGRFWRRAERGSCEED